MFLLGVLCILFATASAEFCYNEIEKSCGLKPLRDNSPTVDCNAKYGSFDSLQTDLQGFANANLQASFEYLLMSTHFGNYEANREGFKKLYRKYSDKLWEDTIDIMKYIAKRGGKMNFNERPHFKKSEFTSKSLNEINSLAEALDIHKQLAKEALRIHTESQLHAEHKRDAAVAHYLEEQFMESHTECVRDLAGYTNDLKKLVGERDASVSVFLFDEFLKKSL